MKKIFFTLASIAALSTSTIGFADQKDESTHVSGVEVPAHLNETLNLLDVYKQELEKELIEDTKNNKDIQEIIKVSQNLHTINKVIVLIKSVQVVHATGDVHQTLDMKQVHEDKKTINSNLEQKHLLETIHFLNAYVKKLIQELHEDVEKGDKIENIAGVADNIRELQEGIVLLNSMSIIHNHDK